MYRYLLPLLCGVVLTLSTNTVLLAQEPTEEPQVVFQSSVGLGTSGFTQQNDIALQDSLGMAYDLASLLKDPAIRQSAQIPDDLYQDILSQHQQQVSQLFSQALSDLSSEQRQELKQQFLDLQLEMQQQLTEQQRSNLQAARFQQAIQRYGLEKVLESEILGKRFPLDETELSQVLKDYTQARRELQQQKSDLLAQANQQWLDHFPDSIEPLKSVLQSTVWDAMLKQPMFPKDQVVLHRHRPQISALLRWLDKADTQKKLKLTTTQIRQCQKIKERKERDDAQQWLELQDVLSDEQLQIAQQTLIAQQCEYFGTVNAWTRGLPAVVLQLTDQQQQDLQERGKQIHGEYKERLRQATQNALIQSFQSLPDRKRRYLTGQISSDLAD